METYNGWDPWSSNQIRVQLSSCRLIDSDPEPTLVWSVAHFTPIQHTHIVHTLTHLSGQWHIFPPNKHTHCIVHTYGTKFLNWYFTQRFCSYI